MKITTLSSHPELIPLISKWHFGEWGDVEPFETEQEMVDDYKNRWMKEDPYPVLFLAMEGEELVGTIGITDYDLEGHNDLTPWMTNLFVNPAHRQKGIAAKLIEQVFQKAQEFGIKTLYLYTQHQETMYLHRGWETIERTTHKGFDIVIMKLIIKT